MCRDAHVMLQFIYEMLFLNNHCSGRLCSEQCRRLFDRNGAKNQVRVVNGEGVVSKCRFEVSLLICKLTERAWCIMLNI